ncbi:hypothetical protein M441DRAFT_148644 [Trichoderma asperellum CBS 433.97]|uniref:Uncharacterized protein n=1 Tax=Trichoderma asperellum (strain ATCC 204424 / CBS 433.97 / NBRC 101777) TaxID=1042311 RepID=A0A2T3YX93_TRIA4|nr:hypothetical protein M441DRAFT_148644 [Trichoderma asperellum CBS 433.97]PTB37150.1 hypothetical protein M441DRAFT_148644 [Trichoderma asperellum CBS 433.97]
MSQPRRPKTEEEVEAEVQFYGLTNQSAAAIVRFGNALKGARKLEREHIELLAPGRRLHPPSPLSQPVWKQADIEDSPRPQPGEEVEPCGLDLEAAGADPIESPALIYAVPGVDDIPAPHEPPPSLKFRRRVLSPIQEEEEDEEVKGEEEEEEEEMPTHPRIA